MRLYATVGFNAKGEAEALYVGPNFDEAVKPFEGGADKIVEVEIYRLTVPFKRRLTPEGHEVRQKADAARDRKAAEAAAAIVAENKKRQEAAKAAAEKLAAKNVEQGKSVSPKQVSKEHKPRIMSGDHKTKAGGDAGAPREEKAKASTPTVEA